ncbi:hypothetical protein J2Z44_002514 [Clostridium punense]|uniref:Uncharacterized protein n=2 Tax=Clostridium TaxID=1485 RepID=A0ABS4K4H7_9CLOT|nr:hypothetical protein [Clostridium punense]MBP2022691.1 hypothetical protein [Clostridium punense]
MNITSNSVGLNNYSTNLLNMKNNKSINKNINIQVSYKSALEEKKISEEEDAILYELYKSDHSLHTAFTFEECKKAIVSFPPPTAPGSVRRAWREKWESATPEVKKAMRSFDSVYSAFLMHNEEYNGNMPNDLNGYFKFMGTMKGYIQNHYYNVPGVSHEFYESLMNLTSGFETELMKYL